MTDLRAFHNDASLKDFLLAELAKHREHDRIIRGTYWENGRGCAVGCTLEALRIRSCRPDIDHESHITLAKELDIPLILVRFEDHLFERLPAAESQAWPERFTRAIKVGADLSMIWPRFALWLLTEEVPRYVQDRRSLVSLEKVGALYKEWCEGIKPSIDRWQTARKIAVDAAYAAVDADDVDAIRSAIHSATTAAIYTDDAEGAASAACVAADSIFAGIGVYTRQADKLIELMEAA